MNLEKQKENFKNHIATFTDYGDIKILDFKAPDTNHYRIRFLFEETYCRLHISGDLGHLIAMNYNNMAYEKFSDYINNTGYFEEKIQCIDRHIYVYDEEKARSDIKEWLENNNCKEHYLILHSIFLGQTDGEVINEFMDEVLKDYSEDTGIGSRGYKILSRLDPDVWGVCDDFGKENTGILDLYMLAFKLAQDNLKKG